MCNKNEKLSHIILIKYSKLYEIVILYYIYIFFSYFLFRRTLLHKENFNQDFINYIVTVQCDLVYRQRFDTAQSLLCGIN